MYCSFQNRFNKSVRYLKKLIKKKIGKIVTISLSLLWCRYQNYYNDTHGTWKNDGGVINQQAIHHRCYKIYFLTNQKGLFFSK